LFSPAYDCLISRYFLLVGSRKASASSLPLANNLNELQGAGGHYAASVQRLERMPRSIRFALANN